MALGAAIKGVVDSVRDMLGLACTLDGVSLGACSYHDLSPEAVRDLVSDEFADEINTRWALIECGTTTRPQEQQKIVVTATGEEWVVRRVSITQAAGTVIGYRCYCSGQLVV